MDGTCRTGSAAGDDFVVVPEVDGTFFTIDRKECARSFGIDVATESGAGQGDGVVRFTLDVFD